MRARRSLQGNRDHDVTRTAKPRQAGKRPISAHPIFPVVVAIWFAALLGLGSLILPVILFEKIFAVTGLASVFPSTQAPLGMTARLLIALTAAVLGGVAGMAVARKVTGSQAQPGRSFIQRDSRRHSSAKEPINAMEELGSEGFDEPLSARAAPAARRRSLAVTDDSGPSDFFEFAPLPGGGSGIDDHSYLDAGPLDLEEAIGDDEADEDEDLALDLAHDPVVTQPLPDISGAGLAAGDVRSPVDFVAAASDDDFRPSPTQFFQHADERTHGVESVDMTQEHFGHSAYNPLADREPVESVPARPFAMPDAYTPPLHSAPDVPSEAPLAARGMGAPAMTYAGNPDRPLSDLAPLSDLGIAELIERFASSLQRHAAPTAAPAAAPVQPPVPVVTAGHDVPAGAFHGAQEANEAPMVFRRAQSAMPSSPAPTGASPAFTAPAAPPAAPAPAPTPYAAPAAYAAPAPAPTPYAASPVPATLFGKAGVDAATVVPAALRPFAIDEHDDHDEADDFAGLSLSLEQRLPETGESNSPEHYAEPMDDGDSTGDDNYSSLLAMKSALSTPREFVRIDDDEQDSHQVEPVVVFPGQDQTVPAPAAHSFGAAPSAAIPPRQEQAPRRFDSPAAAPAPRPADAGETERALREALEKLQRMSGAA